MLRDYQQNTVELTIEFIKRHVEPCVIEAATGAGKSHIIAALAAWIRQQSQKRVLVLAPRKELMEQNFDKYLMTGHQAGLYGAGKKDLYHPVIFGTPQSVIRNTDEFRNYAAVIVDECHGITPTIKQIIEHLKIQNSNLRVIGLTATPYRLGEGYIYRVDENNKVVQEDKARDPYFEKLICRITARELIDRGYLTPPSTEAGDGYKAKHLNPQANGRFIPAEVRATFEGNRLTADIVREVIELSKGRKGVMFFAATVPHAEEILEALPPFESSMVSCNLSKGQREKILEAFKSQQIKYIVNKDILTTGFDAVHVDVIAILRHTESVSLLQQIIGRGMRLDDGKEDCLVLDYAQNIEKHCPDGDIFAPEIKARKLTEEGEQMQALCPECGGVNIFKERPNDLQLDHNEYGYYVDLEGNQMDYPAHYGRRCQFVDHRLNQCSYRWVGKECDECGHINDIAARYCEACKAEIVDPNEKLKRTFAKIKKDPYTLTTDKVLGWYAGKHMSINGNETLKVDYTTDYRTFTVWYLPKKRRLWCDLCMAVFGRIIDDVDGFIDNLDKASMPTTVSSKRRQNSKFFDVVAHNQPEDMVQDEVSSVA